MTRSVRIALLSELGTWLRTGADESLETAIRRAYIENRWFTEENTRQAINNIATQFLDADRLTAWAAQYPIHDLPHPQKDIGIIAAGNIPLVGFHDWFCVFVAGHRAKLKCSEKDKVLLPFLINKMTSWNFEAREYTYFLQDGEPLKSFDAVIATGSNNSARHFEQYFSKYPHIIRKNRNSVAILTGNESTADLLALGADIFSYFGLGCRNVTKLYLPTGYNLDLLLEPLHEFRDLIYHDKWKNNFDYNVTLFILNKIPYHNNGCLILREDPGLAARLACVHYEFYTDLATLALDLQQHKEAIQCLVGNTPVPGFVVTPFGQTQAPALSEYADGIDTLAWLCGL